MISRDGFVHGKGPYTTHKWFDEEEEFWIGKKIHNLLSGETKTSWVRMQNNWAIVALEMKFHLSRTQKYNSQQSSPHGALTDLDRADFHPVPIR